MHYLQYIGFQITVLSKTHEKKKLSDGDVDGDLELGFDGLSVVGSGESKD